MRIALGGEAQATEAGVRQAVLIGLAPCHHAQGVEANLADVAVRAPVAPPQAGRGTSFAGARTRNGKAHRSDAAAVVRRSGNSVLTQTGGVVPAFGCNAPPIEARTIAVAIGIGGAHAVAAFPVDARLTFGARAREDVASLTPRGGARRARAVTHTGAGTEEHRKKERSQVPHALEWYARTSRKGRLKVGF